MQCVLSKASLLLLNGPDKLLNVVEEDVTLLDDFRELCVLFVGSAGLHNIPHLVNLGAYATSGDEP